MGKRALAATVALAIVACVTVTLVFYSQLNDFNTQKAALTEQNAALQTQNSTLQTQLNEQRLQNN